MYGGLDIQLSSGIDPVDKTVACLPLPHHANDSPEFQYVFGVMVLLQSLLFSLCSLCEEVNHVSGRVMNVSTTNKNSRPNDLQFVVLGSLASGLLYTTACLVPADCHSHRPAAPHTALVYCGLVVSCAMNPYLHLYGVRVERHRGIKEERLLKIVNRTRL